MVSVFSEFNNIKDGLVVNKNNVYVDFISSKVHNNSSLISSTENKMKNALGVYACKELAIASLVTGDKNIIKAIMKNNGFELGTDEEEHQRFNRAAEAIAIGFEKDKPVFVNVFSENESFKFDVKSKLIIKLKEKYANKLVGEQSIENLKPAPGMSRVLIVSGNPHMEDSLIVATRYSKEENNIGNIEKMDLGTVMPGVGVIVKKL